MKKILLFFTLIELFHLHPCKAESLLDYQEPMALCLGDVVFHQEVTPDLCLYYNGDKLVLDVNHEKKQRRIGQASVDKKVTNRVPYSLYYAKAIQQMHILICAQPAIASLYNTVSYMYVPNHVAYKFYTLTAARHYNADHEVAGYTWHVEEEQLLDDRIIPENTIIFLFNAHFVDTLQAKMWSVQSNIRLLPSIVIKKNIDIHVLNNALAQARIVGLDFDAIHRRHPEHNAKREQKTVMSIASHV